mgnify:CR=1 FL=1
MQMIEAFREFENKYATLKRITTMWYKVNCGVFSKNKPANVKHKNGEYSEEWYRARMVWSLVKAKYFEPEKICVEFTIPKGSEGAKALEPDIVIFTDDDWKKEYDKWDKESKLPEQLARKMLLVAEAKDDVNKVEKAVTKQISEAMNSAIGCKEVYGMYFDCKDDILLFKKEGNNAIQRYYVDKELKGDEIEKLNLANRDSLEQVPKFEELLMHILPQDAVDRRNFGNTQALSEESFSEILETINRTVDRLGLSRDAQDLIVEYLTLKVADEKEVLRNKKKYFEFYIKEDELNGVFGNQSFRNRMKDLYERSKKEYNAIFNPPALTYSFISGSLKPSHPDDEQMLISIIRIFQEKKLTIIGSRHTSFNQIIFNNFGNNIEKAKEKQFFTPVPVVEAIVKMVNPQKNEKICDPCSGICDFLAMAFRHVNRNDLSKLMAADNYYGFDKDNKILKLAELNLVLNGDGNAKTLNMNTIDHKLLVNGESRNDDFNIDNYNIEDWSNKNDESKNVQKYDVILTNPPFGRGRDLQTGKNSKWDIPKKTIQLYEVWEEKGRPKSIDMGVIFLENAYKTLEEGGRMAIILSNSIASIADWECVRKWFIERMRIVALVDLPSNTFGQTGVATTVIIAYKPRKNEMNILSEDYEVFVKEIEHVGYTVKEKNKVIDMPPDYMIDETTFEIVCDDHGNKCILSDFPSLVSEFGEWLEKNKYIYKEIYKSFAGECYQEWED